MGDLISGSAPDFISDADMATLQAQGRATAQGPAQMASVNPARPDSVQAGPDIGGAARTGLDSFSNAVTAGYLPQVQAATAPAVDHTLFWAWKHGLVPGLDPKNAPDSYDDFKDNKTYVERRDQAIKDLASEKAAHPVASGIGTVAGALTQGALAAPLLGAGPAAEGVGTLSGLAPRLARGAAIGAGMGAVQNPGDTEGQISPLQLGDRGSNAATGAVTGGLTQGLIEGLSGAGNALKNAPQTLEDFAKLKAVKALGADKATFKKLQMAGQVGPLGRSMLDQDIVTPLATPNAVAARLGPAIEDKSNALNTLIGNAQSATQDLSQFSPEQQQSLKAAQFNPKAVGDNLKQQILAKYPHVPQQELQPALDKIDAWLGTKQGTMSLSQVQDMKQQMGRFLKDSDFDGQPQGFGKEGVLSVRRALKEGVENGADAYANVLGAQGGAVKQTNQELGQLLQANKISQNQIARDSANRAFGLTDTIMGGEGANLGGQLAGAPGAIIGGVVGGLGNKFGRTFGNSLMATSADTASKFLQNNTDALSKIGTPVLNALKNNPTALNVATQSATQNPSFTSAGTVQKQQDYQMAQDPQFLNLLKTQPQLIDTIQNPNLRQLLRSRLGVSGRDPSRGAQTAPTQTRVVPDQEAQKQFLQGNQ